MIWCRHWTTNWTLLTVPSSSPSLFRIINLKCWTCATSNRKTWPTSSRNSSPSRRIWTAATVAGTSTSRTSPSTMDWTSTRIPLSCPTRQSSTTIRCRRTAVAATPTPSMVMWSANLSTRTFIRRSICKTSTGHFRKIEKRSTAACDHRRSFLNWETVETDFGNIMNVG